MDGFPLRLFCSYRVQIIYRFASGHGYASVISAAFWGKLMQFYSKLLIILVVMLIAATLSAQPIELAQTKKQMCLHTCIEQYGTDKKRACAMQCGFQGGAAAGGQAQDCGMIYKQCMKSCGPDKNCKNTCRKQRTNCY
jgi:hypothetical protein